WVDALMRYRLLTPYQAAEINAGRGEQLLLGPLVLYHPPERLGYADQYLARDRDSGEQVRVIVAKLADSSSDTAALQQLQSLAEQLQRAQQAETAQGVLPLAWHGIENHRLWIVHPCQSDVSLRELLLRG